MAGHAGDRETVTAGLADARPEARRVALGAAARLGMLSADSLRPYLSDPDQLVRHRAVDVVPGLTDGADMVDDLIALLGPEEPHPDAEEVPAADPSDEISPDDGADDLAEVAAFAIGELQLDGPARQRATNALGRQATDHPDALCRESAVAALGALEVGVEFILAATSDVATVRRRAVLALAPFDGAAVSEAIERALTDRDWQVRQAAEDLLDPGGP